MLCKIKEVVKFKFNIISEPGDATHYDYYITTDVNMKTFKFNTTYNCFRYPQVLNINILDCNDAEIMGIAKLLSVNFWTVKECIRGINQVFCHVQIKNGEAML